MLMQDPDRIRLATTPEPLLANHQAGLRSATIEMLRVWREVERDVDHR